MLRFRILNTGFIGLLLLAAISAPRARADGRAHTNSQSRYIHQIDLYDVENRKITPDSTLPYSTLNTCGRCHDYKEISHGWHFNAFSEGSRDGRESEPWIWSDPRTGTQLPLSYRDGRPSANPRAVGLSAFDITRKFGGRLPGGAVGEVARENEDSESLSPRWKLTGSLEIDCMACHAIPGLYDFSVRKDQIESENFAWAPTAALGLGDVKGDVSRIKDDADPTDEKTKEKMPTVTYRSNRFAPDGTVRMDLVRVVSNNACYACHSQSIVVDGKIEARWIHDDDVHIQSGMNCVDCHRNGIDHEIVRGFLGADHSDPGAMQTLSCVGCHIGIEADHSTGDAPTIGGTLTSVETRPGRLGSPHPDHVGLPPVHFEKLSCTACHSGPMPRDEAIGMMTSLAHGLGEAGHRTGTELPKIAGPVYARRDDGRVYPHRAVWPAFWGKMDDAGEIQPLSPEDVYEWTRKSLRVRRDFVEELILPKLKSTQLKEALGEERAKVDAEEWTAEESAKVSKIQADAGREAFEEKIPKAIEAIEKELPGGRAVYVSSGFVYGRDDAGKLETIESDAESVQMQTWPIGHNVRPAGWSLGTKGCLECHADDGKIFASTVSAVGPGPDSGAAITMAEIQGVDADQRLLWNQLFSGRASFKYVIGGSITALTMMLLVGLGAIATRRNES